MSESLPIVTGDPDDGPASFSRFLLPFSYRKQSCESCSTGSLGFVREDPPPAVGIGQASPAESDPSHPSRYHRHYLTFETAHALYERALWLTLEGEDTTLAKEFSIYRPVESGEARPIRVKLAAPRIVLFEWLAKAPEGKDDEDPLATGFLILELSFRNPPLSLDDLCFVNDLFRFWMRPFGEHEKGKHYQTALKEAPQHLSPCLAGKVNQDPYLDRWVWLLDLPCKDGTDSFRLVSCGAQSKARTWTETGKDESGWVVYSDARTYVWTCAVVAQGAGNLAKERAWTCLLNVDPPGNGTLSRFERDWTKKRTYGRWVESGSLYGFTIHSGAAIVPQWREPPLWQHFRESYFDQTLLLLYARVGLFRFSRWLSEVSAAARNRGTGLIDRNLEQDLSRIRKSLTLFANLYQFPLLSNQQQGIEMYEKAREVMDIRELAEELHAQVDGCHELLDMLADREETLAARRLNVVAAGGLALAVATGFLGMNIVAEGIARGSWHWQGVKEWGVFLLTAAAAFGLLLLASRQWRRVEKLLFRDSERDNQ